MWPGPGPYLRRSYGEAVYVLDDTVTFTLAEVKQIYRAGSLCYPARLQPRFANWSADAAGILPVAAPGVIGLVEELFRLERAGQAGAQAGLDHAQLVLKGRGRLCPVRQRAGRGLRMRRG